MGLIDDQFVYTNVIPNQGESWSPEDSQRVWQLFVDGKGLSEIARMVGRKSHAVKCQVENQLRQFHRHPGTRYVGDRDGMPWSGRDQWIYRYGKAYKIPKKSLQLLLGRTVLLTK